MYILDGDSFFDRFVVAMKNGDLDSKGPLASIIASEGTIESFKVRFLPIMQISCLMCYVCYLWP